jgi:hypothetical protein
MNTPETPDTQQQPFLEPAVPAVEPTPVVEVTPVVEATPMVEPPPVAAILETVELPAATDAGSAEPGGEWQELLDRLNGWLGEGRVSEVWQQSQRPLKALGAALALLLVLRLLGSVLGALDGVPMLPRLLQLVGLIWLGLYSSRNLVRSDSRQRLLARVDGIWRSVVGRAD